MTADPGAAARAPHVVHATLEAWGNFYLITGTAAATLTGLQFIVQTLLASDARPLGDGDPEGGIAAFGSPTVVHLSLALLLSAVLSAPWVGYVALRVTLGLLGAGALVYSGVVLRRRGGSTAIRRRPRTGCGTCPCRRRRTRPCWWPA